jgi:hypothetical protein
MRYSLILLAMTLGAPLTLPLSVSAQAAEEDSLSSWQVDAGASLEQPASEEPALQLELDDAGVGVVPPPPRTLDGYTLEEMELRVKRARIGLGVSAGVYALGLALFVSGAAGDCNNIFTQYLPNRCQPLYYTGTVTSLFGIVGMITSGVLLRRHKHDRDRLRRAHHGTPRRAQCDLARSRLVF